MPFKRLALASSALVILALMVGLAYFALPPNRQAAATTYLILSPTPSVPPPPITIGGTLEPSGQPRLPEIENLSGRLLFTYRYNLYVAGFDGSPAHLIAQDIRASSIHVAPDQRSLIHWVRRFDAIGQRISIVELINLETLTASTLITFSGLVDLVRWSADGAWVALDLHGDGGNPLNVLIASRTQPIPPTILDNYSAAAWLQDNRLLITAGTDTATQFAVFDPNSGAITLLDMPADHIVTLQGIRSIYSPDYAAAASILAEMGLHPVWTPTYQQTPELGVSPDATQWVAGTTRDGEVCQPYQIVQHTVADNSTSTLAEFTEPYTLRLSNFQWAADDTLYFVRWSAQTCPLELATADTQLYRLAMGEEPILLGEGLLAEVYLHGYDVAPDGGFVVWVGYDGESHLSITDVNTGETRRLITLGTHTYPVGFTSVWWLR